MAASVAKYGSAELPIRCCCPDLPSALEFSVASSQHPRSTTPSAWREVATSPVAPASRPWSPHKQRSSDVWERHHREPAVRHSRSGSVSIARRLSRGKECGSYWKCTRRVVQCMRGSDGRFVVGISLHVKAPVFSTMLSQRCLIDVLSQRNQTVKCWQRDSGGEMSEQR